jgi:hypothetical protein
MDESNATSQFFVRHGFRRVLPVRQQSLSLTAATSGATESQTMQKPMKLPFKRETPIITAVTALLLLMGCKANLTPLPPRRPPSK